MPYNAIYSKDDFVILSCSYSELVPGENEKVATGISVPDRIPSPLSVSTSGDFEAYYEYDKKNNEIVSRVQPKLRVKYYRIGFPKATKNKIKAKTHKTYSLKKTHKTKSEK